MDCFIELSSNIKSFIHYKKIKENSDRANNILTKSEDFGFKFDDLIVKNFLRHNYKFTVSINHQNSFTEAVKFFD